MINLNQARSKQDPSEIQARSKRDPSGTDSPLAMLMFDMRMLGLLGDRDTEDAERRAGFGERAGVVGDRLMGPRHEKRPQQGLQWGDGFNLSSQLTLW